MWPGRAADHSPPSSAAVIGRVELYLYPPSGSHRACNGTLYLYIHVYQMQLLVLKVIKIHIHCTTKGQTFMSE